VVAGGLAASAAGVSGGLRRAWADDLQDGPNARDPTPWMSYERRLRTRLADAGGGRFDQFGATAILELTNLARSEAGAGLLEWREDLALTARAHAADIARRKVVAHISPEGFDPSHRFWLLSRTTIGSPAENIAFASSSPAAPTASHLMDVWRASPPHWANLLRTTHTAAGFGLVRTGDEAWLVGLYARPLATLAQPLPLKPSAMDIARAMDSLPRALRPRIGEPQGAGPVDGELRVLQLQAQRREAGDIELIGGPVFLAARIHAPAIRGEG
jgi:hypothetical protein